MLPPPTEVSINEIEPPCTCRKEKGLTKGWCAIAGFGVPGCEH